MRYDFFECKKPRTNECKCKWLVILKVKLEENTSIRKLARIKKCFISVVFSIIITFPCQCVKLFLLVLYLCVDVKTLFVSFSLIFLLKFLLLEFLFARSSRSETACKEHKSKNLKHVNSFVFAQTFFILATSDGMDTLSYHVILIWRVKKHDGDSISQ